MGSFKNPKKSKWFLVCFKPEESLKFNTGSERNILHQNILFAPLSNGKPESRTENSSDGGGKSRRRRFPRVFKNFFSNTASTLSKKKRNKRSDKETCNNMPLKFEKIFNTSSEKKSKSLLSSSFESMSISSTQSSLFSSTIGPSLRSSPSSSSISSMVSNSRSGSGRKQACLVDLKELKPNNKVINPPPQQQKKKEDGIFSTQIGLCFMLICLFGLIIWGKAFAIFCTSTCLFLVPCIFKGEVTLEEYEEDDDSIVDIDSDEYTKKFITEGLLERNRPRKL